MKTYTSTYTNEWQETWHFSFDYDKCIATLIGSDNDNIAVPVYDGVAYNLVLNKNEKEWLETSWRQATQHLGCLKYVNHNTAFIHNSQYCYMTNDYCPLCMRVRKDFEKHHCIAKSDGGHDISENILNICCSCHAIITRGNEDEMNMLNHACVFHQISHFGLKLIPRKPRATGKYKYVDFLLARPATAEMLRALDTLLTENSNSANNLIMNLASIEYQFCRDSYLERIDRKVYEERIIKSSNRAMQRTAGPGHMPC